MATRLLLVDLDDTLWATYVNNKKSLEQLYTALNWGQYFVSFEDFFSAYYRINIELWERYNHGRITKQELALERLRLPLEPYLSLPEQSWREIDEQFLSLVKQQTLLCPNALETMAYLKARYSICILSNGFGEVQYAKIEKTGLAPYIDQVVLSEDVGINKPAPEIFHIALERMGATPSESLMIGDSFSSDIAGASNAGIGSIWYNAYAFPMPQTEGITPPLHIINNLAELKTLL
ncbi:MAG: YjjG family noncanonical pyrimidine nucleotidase [Porphyromonadaceae bacterium]|nr:YjjG family noncanonical pyrimidine nucleotidase [Porphyromonadaceae bacterium]